MSVLSLEPGSTVNLAPPLINDDGSKGTLPHCTTDSQGRLICSY
jgi:hypothetical protein